MERRRANMSQEKDETSPLTGKSGGDSAKATVCSRVQAPIQSVLRPAMWVPGLNRLHSHREVWKTEDSTPQKNMTSVKRALLKVIETDKSHSSFHVSKVEDGFLQIHVFTRAEWLDIIEMNFDGDEIKISAFSSGFLPLIIPGACLLNLVFFWVPFLDMGMNEKRLKWLVSHMNVPVQRSSL